jgi:hypothetical protein
LGSIPSRGKRFLTLDNMQNSSVKSPIQWVPGAVSPEVKWQGCEADHSPPSSAKKNGHAIRLLPHAP